MKLNLSTGQADLIVFFSTEENRRKRRVTTAILTAPRYGSPIPNETFVIDVESICSNKDNFSRRVGRHEVANKLLDAVRFYENIVNLNKEDRKIIFSAICPFLIQ